MAVHFVDQLLVALLISARARDLVELKNLIVREGWE